MAVSTISSITLDGVDLDTLGGMSVVVRIGDWPEERYEYDPALGEWWRIDGMVDEVNMILRRVMGNGEV